MFVFVHMEPCTSQPLILMHILSVERKACTQQYANVRSLCYWNKWMCVTMVTHKRLANSTNERPIIKLEENKQNPMAQGH